MAFTLPAAGNLGDEVKGVAGAWGLVSELGPDGDDGGGVIIVIHGADRYMYLVLLAPKTAAIEQAGRR